MAKLPHIVLLSLSVIQLVIIFQRIIIQLIMGYDRLFRIAHIRHDTRHTSALGTKMVYKITDDLADFCLIGFRAIFSQKAKVI